MNLVTMLAAVFVSPNTPSGFAPDGPPASVSLSYYGGSGILVTWVDGDSEAATQIGISADDDDELVGSIAEVGPTVNEYETDTMGNITNETGAAGPTRWWARHKKNGHTSEWVRASKMVTDEEPYVDDGGGGGGGPGGGGELET